MDQGWVDNAVFGVYTDIPEHPPDSWAPPGPRGKRLGVVSPINQPVPAISGPNALRTLFESFFILSRPPMADVATRIVGDVFRACLGMHWGTLETFWRL